MIIGIGARRGVNKEEVISAIEAALAEAGMKSDDIDMFASSTLKENETGLLEAVNVLGKEIKFLSEEDYYESAHFSEDRIWKEHNRNRRITPLLEKGSCT